MLGITVLKVLFAPDTLAARLAGGVGGVAVPLATAHETAVGLKFAPSTSVTCTFLAVLATPVAANELFT